MAMRIATYNVNGVNGRLPRLLEWLEETKPDVACLQEIKTGDATFPAEKIEKAGYGAIWHGQKSHHGVAILAKGRKPEERRRMLPGFADDRASRYLECEIDGIVVSSVYLPNGNPVPSANFDYKLRWFGHFIEHARDLIDAKKPVILAGDLNVVPTKIDIYNEWLWRFDAVVQPETRELWKKLMAQGWIDITRHRHPDARLYSFWVNAAAFQRNAGFRMDFLLLTPDLLPRVTTDGIDKEYRGREKPSDHTPVWVELAGP